MMMSERERERERERGKKMEELQIGRGIDLTRSDIERFCWGVSGETE